MRIGVVYQLGDIEDSKDLISSLSYFPIKSLLSVI